MTTDPPPQTAAGKVLWHFSMSLDGFIAGPQHSMDWMTGFTGRPGIVEEYAATLGAVLGGREGSPVAALRGPGGSDTILTIDLPDRDGWDEMAEF